MLTLSDISAMNHTLADALDVKISGYIIPKYFGRAEALVEIRRLAQTFTFDTQEQ